MSGTCISLFFYVSIEKENYIENDELFPLIIFNSSFTSDRLGVTALGIIYTSFYNPLKVYTVVTFKKVNFKSIHSYGTGVRLYALSVSVHNSSSSRNDYVRVKMENITAEENIQNLEFEHSL